MSQELSLSGMYGMGVLSCCAIHSLRRRYKHFWWVFGLFSGESQPTVGFSEFVQNIATTPPPFPFHFLSFGFRTDLLSKALKHSCVVQTSTVQVLSIVNPLKSEQLQFTCIQYFSHLRRQNFQHEVKTGILL